MAMCVCVKHVKRQSFSTAAYPNALRKSGFKIDCLD